MNDPLDVVFVTGEEAKRLEHDRQLARLARYLDNMPMDIKPLFKERFILIRADELSAMQAADKENDERTG